MDRTNAGTSIQKAIKVSTRTAGIRKPVTPQDLRHSYATGLFEAGVDEPTVLAGLREEACWSELLAALGATEWVSSIEPLPQERSEPATVIKYLGRYLTGGQITDQAESECRCPACGGPLTLVPHEHRPRCATPCLRAV